MNPYDYNDDISYLFISEVMIRDGFISGRLVHGENEPTVEKLQEIRGIISYNPYINYIYSNRFCSLYQPIN
jgi:hypothetical protein